MELVADTISQQSTSANEIFMGFTSTGWTGIYTIFTIIGTLLIVLSLIFALRSIKQAQQINKENNDLQKDRLLQERLIELSHEWNSKDFITARNHAAILMSEFKDNLPSMYPTLINEKRLDEWVHVSMIAHFFERLSYIQLSDQIYREHAILEFKEAIDYWYFFMNLVYSFNEQDESRIRDALKALKDEYKM